MQTSIRPAIAILCVLALTHCGKKKSESSADQSQDATPRTPDGTSVYSSMASRPECGPEIQGKLIYVSETAEFQSCNNGSWVVLAVAGQAAAAPAITPTSPASSTPVEPPVKVTLYIVYDSANEKLGETDFQGFNRFLESSPFAMKLSDGAVLNIDPVSGGFAGDHCYYESADCSSTCMYPILPGQKNKIIHGTGGFYKVLGSEVLETKSYSSFSQADFPGTLCSTLGSAQTGKMAVISHAYSLSGGLSYPLAAPLRVEAE